MMVTSQRKYLLISILHLPVRAAQLTGSFPLSLQDNPRRNFNSFIKFSWRSVGFFAVIFRIFLICRFVQLFMEHRHNIDRLSTIWTMTMIAVQVANQIVLTFGDLGFVVILILRRRRFNQFLLALENFFQDILQENGGWHDKPLISRFFSGDLTIKRAFAWISAMSVVSMLIAGFFYVPWFCSLFPEWASAPWIIGTILLYYEITIHFRLLAFLPVCALIHILQVGFTLLTKRIERLSDEPGGAKGVIDKYCRLEKFLKELHYIFDLQLICGLFTILASLLVIIFNGVYVVMRIFRGTILVANFGSALTEFASMLPWIMSLCLIFYLISDFSSEMTTAAKQCIWAWRMCPQIDKLDQEERQSIMLFYMEKCTRPPQLRPAGMFRVGRDMFPTVLGILATYVIVLYQFEEDENLYGKGNG